MEASGLVWAFIHWIAPAVIAGLIFRFYIRSKPIPSLGQLFCEISPETIIEYYGERSLLGVMNQHTVLGFADQIKSEVHNNRQCARFKQRIVEGNIFFCVDASYRLQNNHAEITQVHSAYSCSFNELGNRISVSVRLELPSNIKEALCKLTFYRINSQITPTTRSMNRHGK